MRRALRAREELSDLRRQIQSSLLRLGVRYPGTGKAWTKQFMAWLTDVTLAEAEQRRLVTMVGCNMRFHPGPAMVKKLIDAGAVGELWQARLAACKPRRMADCRE